MEFKKNRIITAVKTKYPDLSQKQIKKLLLLQLVKVDGRVAKPHQWVERNTHITIESDVLVKRLQANKKINCQLVSKTKNYIVFAKDCEVHSVAHDFLENETAANWLLSIDSSLNQVSKPLESGLLHRLDQETSGIMVAARNADFYKRLKNQFAKQKVYKEYACVVDKEPPKTGVYLAFAGKKPGTSKRIHIQKTQKPDQRLKKIQTEILSATKLKNHTYKIRIRLISGYRHQIRAHLALLGCPIVGDNLYGGSKGKRLMLHASKIGFFDGDDQFVEFEFLEKF